MPANKKKEPKFLSFISQNFSSSNRNKTNGKEPACPINTLSQLLEPSSLAVPKTNIPLRTNKSKPCSSSSRQERVDINNITDNISAGSSNAMMNNTGVGCSKSVHANQGSIINAPCKDSSGFAVPTMRAPRAQKNNTKLIEEMRQTAMFASCILDEDVCKKLISIVMFDCLNHIELYGLDNPSQHDTRDENDSINMVKEWFNKLDETPGSGTGQFRPALLDIDNVSSISGYNSIHQGPSYGNLNSSVLRPEKLLLPRFMTIDSSILGLPALKPYGNQIDMMRSNGSVAGMPEQALSERAMSMRMDGSFMSNRNCMDNASMYSAMPYTPAYSHSNQLAYRGRAGNNHHSNAYFSNRRLHSLMEDRESIPHSYNTENISYLDNMRGDQGVRLRDLQPRVMVNRLEYLDNGLSKVPAFSNAHGRTGSVQDFQRSYNHHPRYFDTSSSVRRNSEENEDMQERYSNAPIQSGYRMKDTSMIRRMNGGYEALEGGIGRPFEARLKDSTMNGWMNGVNEAFQENIGRPFGTRSKDFTINGANEALQENIRRPFEARLKDSTMIRMNENMQENVGRTFDNRSKDSTMLRRINEDAQEKVASRLFENRSRDPSFLRRMNCGESQKENVPCVPPEYRSRDPCVHHIREKNSRRTASNNDGEISALAKTMNQSKIQIRSRDSCVHHKREKNSRSTASNNHGQISDEAVEDETPRIATRSATRSPTSYSTVVRHTVQVHAPPTPAAAKTMNQSKIVCVTRSGRAVRAPTSYLVAADTSYLSPANNQSNRGCKRKRVATNK